MARVRAVSLAAGLLAAQGCNTLHAEDVPAVLVEPTAESRAELARVVSAALDGSPVLLADDALTEASLLTIERRVPRDIEGRPAAGRVLDPPEQFRLVRSGTRCFLVHQRTGERTLLTLSSCRPAQARP